MNEERGSWYLLTAIILGLGLGLFYAWVINPAEFVDTPPDSLRTDYKDQYRAVIAAAYEATGDLQRAQARLFLLGEAEPAIALVAQAQRYLAGGGNPLEAQAIAQLAAALGQAPTPLPTDIPPTATFIPAETETLSPTPTQTASRTPTAEITPGEEITTTLTITSTITPTPRATRTPRPTETATPSPTPLPTDTPTPTLAPPYVLENQILVCNPALGEPQIQVFVSNAAGIGVSGVEIIITWEGREEHFFTGLKPDIDIGYADYVMTSEVSYTLQVADGGQLIPNLNAPECTEGSDQPYDGSWRLIFSHP
jgi:hypothetical protein